MHPYGKPSRARPGLACKGAELRSAYRKGGFRFSSRGHKLSVKAGGGLLLPPALGHPIFNALDNRGAQVSHYLLKRRCQAFAEHPHIRPVLRVGWFDEANRTTERFSSVQIPFASGARSV